MSTSRQPRVRPVVAESLKSNRIKPNRNRKPRKYGSRKSSETERSKYGRAALRNGIMTYIHVAVLYRRV